MRKKSGNWTKKTLKGNYKSEMLDKLGVDHFTITHHGIKLYFKKGHQPLITPEQHHQTLEEVKNLCTQILLELLQPETKNYIT